MFVFIYVLFLLAKSYPCYRKISSACLSVSEKICLIFVYLFSLSSAALKADLRLLFLIPVLLFVSCTDQRKQEIPDLAHFLLIVLFFKEITAFGILLALSILFAGFFLSECGLIGFGDIKLTAVFTLCFQERIFLVTALASFFCLLFHWHQKGSPKEIPFGPYLCFSMFLIFIL